MGEMLAAAVAFVAVFMLVLWLRGKATRQMLREAGFRLKEKARDLDEAETRYLELHLRELANILIGIDEREFERTYLRAKRRQDEAITGGKERVDAELDVLTKRFPFFQDFDIIGTKHFIPYRDTLHMTSEDDIRERYLDVAQWLALTAHRKNGDKLGRYFRDDDQKILDRIVTETRDRKLKARIDAAMEDFRLFQSAINEYGKEKLAYSRPDMDTPRFSIRTGGQKYSPEIEYWLSFKEPEEYAIYSFFVADSGKTYYSFYRSDASFQKRESLSTR